MGRLFPRGNDTRAHFARPCCVQLPHLFVLHDFSTGGAALSCAICVSPRSSVGRFTVVEKVLGTNHLNRTRCLRDDGAGNRSKDHAPHTTVTMRTQHD